jgi:SAM-dependent methyltransferase
VSRIERNRSAWDADAYRAWVTAYGTPESQAAVLRSDPRHKLRRLLPHLGELDGVRVANPLGSHGRCAVAMALLGAQVTVFDLSSANRRYAVELAEAAGVPLEYVCCDFLEVDLDRYGAHFDLVVMELGITHWFTDLDAFACASVALTKNGERVVLQDFHPATAKRNGYFNEALETTPVPYAVHLEGESLPSCAIRRWTLGEVVTAFVKAGVRIDALHEAPMHEPKDLPEIFTLVGTRVA